MIHLVFALIAPFLLPPDANPRCICVFLSNFLGLYSHIAFFTLIELRGQLLLYYYSCSGIIIHVFIDTSN